MFTIIIYVTHTGPTNWPSYVIYTYPLDWGFICIKSPDFRNKICQTEYSLITIYAKSALITVSKTTKRNLSLLNKNHYSYVKNGEGSSQQNHWRCANRQCNAILKTRKSTGNLVGDNLPSHSHGNQLLKQKAKETEAVVVSLLWDGLNLSIPRMKRLQ